MEAAASGQESSVDAGMIIAALQQTEKIETVVVTDEYIELGSSYETSDQPATSAGGEELQVLEVIGVEQDFAATVDSGVDVSRNQTVNVFRCSFRFRSVVL